MIIYEIWEGEYRRGNYARQAIKSDLLAGGMDAKNFFPESHAIVRCEKVGSIETEGSEHLMPDSFTLFLTNGIDKEADDG